jgi:hypothetical protein
VVRRASRVDASAVPVRQWPAWRPVAPPAAPKVSGGSSQAEPLRPGPGPGSASEGGSRRASRAPRAAAAAPHAAEAAARARARRRRAARVRAWVLAAARRSGPAPAACGPSTACPVPAGRVPGHRAEWSVSGHGRSMKPGARVQCRSACADVGVCACSCFAGGDLSRPADRRALKAPPDRARPNGASAAGPRRPRPAASRHPRTGDRPRRRRRGTSRVRFEPWRVVSVMAERSAHFPMPWPGAGPAHGTHFLQQCRAGAYPDRAAI